ncbi:MAG: hypothetical protein P4L50_18775 [Anaerolineaceae bacterium]|nr:hypothetical protein [Anaerolineaceae bacterium]
MIDPAVKPLAEQIESETNRSKDEKLEPGEILLAEYTYIAQTAFQAGEDRARVTSFYLVSVGTLVAAFLSSQLQKGLQPAVFGAFSALFFVLSLAGVFTILQLGRLRGSWHESVQAMNQIKEFYIRRLPDEGLEQAFRWRDSTIPARYKPWSLSFMLVGQVALLDGATLGAVVVFAGLAFGFNWWIYAIVIGLAFFVGQLFFYRKLLQ